ncbi:hypothetical protein [Ensifer sp. LCM 4579]|uniref:hypothetical protein n=1 Tax=Ensifer sp. LCM 4579 TaxID=1848292 RepID=UPI00155E3EE1|nr:hypothetical protein [Ensifer sp. LCM 4579]
MRSGSVGGPATCSRLSVDERRGRGLRKMAKHMMKMLMSIIAALSLGSLMVLVAVL